MLSPPSPASQVAPGAARTAPWATAVSTTKGNGRSCAAGGSIRSWPDGGRPTAVGWECIAGWSSGRSVGSISSAGCGCGSSRATTSIRGSVIWPRSSSPTDSLSCTASFTGHPDRRGCFSDSKLVRPKPEARVAAFYSFGEGLGGGQYYDCHSLENLMHCQTLLAYEMNGEPLKMLHGAPLRLRVENQL